MRYNKGDGHREMKLKFRICNYQKIKKIKKIMIIS